MSLAGRCLPLQANTFESDILLNEQNTGAILTAYFSFNNYAHINQTTNMYVFVFAFTQKAKIQLYIGLHARLDDNVLCV